MSRTDGVRRLAVVVSLIVSLAIVAAIMVLDPPDVQRQLRLDARRVSDMEYISNRIDLYWDRKKLLPEDLAMLAREPGLDGLPLKDPETGNSYVYEVTVVKTYRLCAVFALESPDELRGYDSALKWLHGAGRHCFDLKPTEHDIGGK